MLRAIHAVYPSRLNLPAKVRRFVDALTVLQRDEAVSMKADRSRLKRSGSSMNGA
jgi:hypothetical protein